MDLRGQVEKRRRLVVPAGSFTHYPRSAYILSTRNKRTFKYVNLGGTAEARLLSLSGIKAFLFPVV